MIVSPEIKRSADGSNTLIHPVIGDSYHSVLGAVGESLHIYIEAGLRSVGKKKIRIFEMGFGSGLNALLTLAEVDSSDIEVEYYTVELYPVFIDTARSLGYEQYVSEELYGSFLSMHEAPWGETVQIHDRFTFLKSEQDLCSAVLPKGVDIVYFDAFSPDSQPDLWSVSVFSKLYEAMNPGGVLVTYSAKGTVKQALREVGFEVKRLPGALGKHHMLRAARP